MSQNNLLQCYNRGCGKQFDPNNNKEGDCTYHPGEPFFHDVYKGWSCCKKKCIDFTEFLNIKGCKTSCHSNVKPPEAEKPSKSDTDRIIEINNKPIVNKPTLKRPPFDSPQITLKPTISSALLDQMKDLIISTTEKSQENQVVVGQSCKNNSCKGTYMGPESNEEICKHHPGTPIFHEGMKYWSCCEKKTTDFSVFLEQPGCTEGKHVWLSKNSNKKIQCRVDWHQTATFVVISIYAKKYNPNLSSVKLNPIRLTVDLFFPEENSSYNHDMELRGVVDVAQSTVNMLPTKIEINLKKAEPGSWAKLDFPRNSTTTVESDKNNEETETSQIDVVDLSDL